MRKVAAETDARVLRYLGNEADMEGVVTTIQREIAEATGCCQRTACESLRRLEAAGLLRRVSRGYGRSDLHPGSFQTATYQLLGAEWS